MSHRLYPCRLFAVCFLALAAILPIAAQTPPGRVQFGASTVMDSGGNQPLASGQLCVLTTDQNDRPMGYNIGGGGQTSASTSQASCSAVTNGYAPTMQVINSAASNPLNAYLRVSTFDSTGSEIRRSKLVQTGVGSQYGGWCSQSGPTVFCDWDNYPVGTIPQPLVQVGPPGPPGASATTTANGSNGSFWVKGNTLKTGSTGLADWPTDQLSSQDPTVWTSRQLDETNIVSPGHAFGHGFAANNIYYRSPSDCDVLNSFSGSAFPGCAYADFDARTRYMGSYNYNHYVGFQADGATDSTYSGTLDSWYGHTSNPRVFGGTVNNAVGFMAQDATVSGSGTIQNQYGLFVEPQTHGTAKNYGIVVAAGSKNGSLFGGDSRFIAGDTGQHGIWVSNIATGPNDWAGIELDAESSDKRLILGSFGGGFAACCGLLNPLQAYIASGVAHTNGLVINTESSSAPLRLATNTTERVRINPDGTVLIDGLTGTGNAYACLTSAGVLYRSSSPCS